MHVHVLWHDCVIPSEPHPFTFCALRKCMNCADVIYQGVQSTSHYPCSQTSGCSDHWGSELNSILSHIGDIKVSLAANFQIVVWWYTGKDFLRWDNLIPIFPFKVIGETPVWNGNAMYGMGTLCMILSSSAGVSADGWHAARWCSARSPTILPHTHMHTYTHTFTPTHTHTNTLTSIYFMCS